ncbi:MAG: hypothetical protein Kow0010_07590 [Dehalococcoidia bacterium]
MGAWRLVSFVLRDADGRERYPMGQDPVGIIIWDTSGAMSAQLGRRDGDGPYVAYFGTIEVEDASEGELTHHVEGGSAARFREDQVRRFRFVDDDTLELQLPPDATGTESTLTWRRISAEPPTRREAGTT